MLQNELKEIRTQLRLAMNGVISTSMREKGIVYKLNFGVPLPEIKQIATTHKPDPIVSVVYYLNHTQKQINWNPFSDSIEDKLHLRHICKKQHL